MMETMLQKSPTDKHPWKDRQYTPGRSAEEFTYVGYVDPPADARGSVHEGLLGSDSLDDPDMQAVRVRQEVQESLTDVLVLAEDVDEPVDAVDFAIEFIGSPGQTVCDLTSGHASGAKDIHG